MLILLGGEIFISSFVTKKKEEKKNGSNLTGSENKTKVNKEDMMEHRGTKSGLGVMKCWRIFFFFPCLMTFFVLVAFYRNQQFLDDNPTDLYGDKFTSPEELKFPNSTDQLVVIAVIVKGETM
jgi:hypothetical protein